MGKKINLKEKLKRKSRVELAEEKRQRVIKVILGLVTAFLMASSILMFAGNSPSSQYTFNKHRFEQVKGRWATKINGKTIYFSYYPASLTNINMSPLIKTRLLNSKLVLLTFDPENMTENMLQASDFVRFTLGYDFLSKNIQLWEGITKPDRRYNLTTVTCNKSSKYMPVLEFKKGNETKIYLNGTCIIAEATTPQEMIAVGDRIRYALYGIMN